MTADARVGAAGRVVVHTDLGTTQRIRAIARLEWADVRRSRWLVMTSALYLALALLVAGIGLRESEVLGFTGMGRVLASFSQALVLLLPLLALTGTALVVGRARESGALEFLLSQPAAREDYFAAVTIVRTAALGLPLVALFAAIAFVSGVVLGQPVPWAFLARALAVSAALLWASVGLGLAMSTTVRDSSRAIVYVLLAWATGAAVLDFALIGSMLAWSIPIPTVVTLAMANPVEAARLALLAGSDGSLDTLGPVGVFLVQRMGAGWLTVAGVTWPVVFGTVLWGIARRRFARAEVI
jgi:ABC-2 type transport system permease protein